MEKKWFLSRTFWVSFSQLLAGIFLLILEQMAAGTVLTLSGVVHIVLRMITTKELTF